MFHLESTSNSGRHKLREHVEEVEDISWIRIGLGWMDCSLRALAVTLMLAFVLLGLCVAPTMGQGVTEGYTLYVTFFYPLHFVYNLQVTIQDQTGRVVGRGFSPDGQMITIPVRTESPIVWISASASGYASGPLTNYVVNPGFWVVGGTSVIPVEIIGGDYWITINLSA